MRIITSTEFESEVIKSQMPVLVDFFTPHCGPCKQIAPLLEQIAEERGTALRVLKVDASIESALAASLLVRAVPTVLIFRDGKPVAQFTGFRPKKDLDKWIDQAIAA